MPHHYKLLAEVRQRGIRLTPQREMILLAVYECEGHVTVDEIYEHVRGQNPCVDISTVYRNLELLCDLGLVMRAGVAEGVVHYEMCFGQEPHHHLVCPQCHCIRDLPDDMLEPVRQRIRTEHGYEPQVNHLALYGTCPTCLERQNTSTDEATV